LCLGFGRIAAALARFLLLNSGDGVSVTGTTRDADKAAQMQAAGVTPLSMEDALTSATLKSVTHILLSIPPMDEGDIIWLNRADLSAAAPQLRWIGYLSTTGVYGDLGGRWAFEWSAVNPASTEGARRALAERQWLSYGRPAHVFRLPGLYGLGRSAFDRLRDGTARRIIKPGQIFSRAHEDDAASALAASIARPNPGAIYNICDDEPAPPQDITEYAAKLLGVDVPPDTPIEAANLSPTAMRFYAESKRVSNARAKSELGWRPLYPTYRNGLEAILAQER
jgi:nucleoside-diphosphate-sugar epimerase